MSIIFVSSQRKYASLHHTALALSMRFPSAYIIHHIIVYYPSFHWHKYHVCLITSYCTTHAISISTSIIHHVILYYSRYFVDHSPPALDPAQLCPRQQSLGGCTPPSPWRVSRWRTGPRWGRRWVGGSRWWSGGGGGGGVCVCVCLSGCVEKFAAVGKSCIRVIHTIAFSISKYRCLRACIYIFIYIPSFTLKGTINPCIQDKTYCITCMVSTSAPCWISFVSRSYNAASVCLPSMAGGETSHNRAFDSNAVCCTVTLPPLMTEVDVQTTCPPHSMDEVRW